MKLKNKIRNGKLALITGASSGIGLELAKIHASLGGDLVLVARRLERLAGLKEELERKHSINVHILNIDLSLESAPDHVMKYLDANGLQVDFLINNAGFSKQGYFHEIAWKSHQDMFMVMMRNLTKLTYLILPGMIARNDGKILNVASSAAFAPGGPLQALYYAIKSFIVSFSQGLAGELESTGVTVTALCPGATNTEFESVSGLDKTPLFSMEKVFSAGSVARDGYEAMLNGDMVKMTALTSVNKLVLKNITFFPAKRILQQIKERQQLTSS